MEKIEVTARFGPDGSIVPLDFSLQGEQFQVFDVGRQWGTDEGKHILVMDVHQRTYHLFLRFSDLTWYRIKDIKPSPLPS
jgi:hypothetical protein